MPIFNNVISINPSRRFGLRGDAPGGKYLPSSPTGMFIGGNIGGTAPWSFNFPFQNVIKQSSAWIENAGTGSYTIGLHDDILTLTGDRVLMKEVSVNADSDVMPPGGTYTLRFTGAGQLRVGNGGSVLLDWVTAGEHTFTHVAGQNLYLFAQGGSIDLGVELLIPGFVEGQIFSTLYLDFLSGLDLPIVRYMDWGATNNNMLTNWADRTIPESNGYVRWRGYNDPLSDDEGCYLGQVPIEVMCALSNYLNADMSYVLPARASDDFAYQAGELIRQTLNPNLLVHIEGPGNETWNSNFAETQLSIGYNDATWREATGTPGSNVAYNVSHGRVNDETIVLVPHEHANGNRTGGNFTFGTVYRVINVTTDTFEIVTDDDLDTPVNFHDRHQIVYWFPTSESSASITINRVDENTGRRAVELWDAFEDGFKDDSRIIELIGTQADFHTRAITRIGVNGTNGRYDLCALSAYFTGQEGWTVGMTFQEFAMVDYAAMTAMLDHIQLHRDAGITRLCGYESGSHIVPALMSEGTLEQRNEFFNAYEASEERRLTLDRWYREITNKGLYYTLHFVTDYGGYAIWGNWGIQRDPYGPPEKRYLAIANLHGWITQAVLPTFEVSPAPIYRQTFAGITNSTPADTNVFDFQYGTWEIQSERLVGAGTRPPVEVAYSWLIGRDCGLPYGHMSFIFNANGGDGDEAGAMISGVDSQNFIDGIILSGSVRVFSITAGTPAQLDGGVGYAIPSYDVNTNYKMDVYRWGTALRFYIDDVLAHFITTSDHITGTHWGIKSSNGIYQTYDDIMLPDFYVDQETVATIFGLRHSMISYTGGAPAIPTTYTDAFNWMPLMATNSSVTATIPATSFGNAEGINNRWVTDNLDNDFVSNTFTHYTCMAPNFVQNYVNDPLPNQSPAEWAAHFDELAGRVIANDPNVEMLIVEAANYARLVEGAYPIDDTDLTPEEATRWRAFHRNDSADWYVNTISEMLVLRPNVKFRIVPFAQILCDLMEADFMSTAVWTDFFGDNSPHGKPTYYFLTALVLHRAVFGTDAELTGFSWPEGHGVLPLLVTNVSNAILLIGDRMDYYQLNENSPYRHMVY